MATCSNCGSDVDGAFCANCGSPIHPDGDGPSKGPIVGIIVAVVAILAVVGVVLAIVLNRGGGSEKPDTTVPATVATTAPTTVTSPATVTQAPSPVLSEPAGLMCRDLKAKGYSYGEAVLYWEHHGRPENMDASGAGIPCQSVYDREDVVAHWGEAAENQPVDLDHPLLWGYDENKSNVEGSPWLISDLADDIAWLNTRSSVQWDETRLLALGASRCNNMWVVGEVDEETQRRDEKKWAEAMAPVLGMPVDDVHEAITAGLGYKYSTLCE